MNLALNRKYTNALVKVMNARKELERLENEVAELNSELARSVKMTKKGETTTLTYGDRVLKVTKNRRGRWMVRENGVVANGDYLGSLHHLRISIALGDVSA